jgi:saccharopine dehydrogenase-like NADP-dependent oxidoreductase
MRAEIEGSKEGKRAVYTATMVDENTARAAGSGTGSVAELLLEGKIDRPGIYPVEQVLPTDLFNATMEKRGIAIDRHLAFF